MALLVARGEATGSMTGCPNVDNGASEPPVTPKTSAIPGPSSIHFYLVRYGHLGRIGWFGTVSKQQLARGDRVVVQAIDGSWLGTILRKADPQASVTPRGELVGAAESQDLESEQRTSLQIPPLLQLAQAELLRCQLSANVLDADISLDHQVGVLQFAGDGGAALGPLAAKLAERLQLGRVQWLALEDSSVVQTDPRLQAESQLAELDKQRLNNHHPATPGAKHLDQFPQGCQSIADGQLEGAELRRFANRYRDQLGLAGTYLQTVRSTSPSGNSSVDRTWMIRVKATGGQMTIGQFQGLIELCRRFGDGTLRLTMRQGLQFHYIGIREPFQLLAAIDDLAMTTRGSCGNALRNVTCCPLTPRSNLQDHAKRLAARLANRWLPRANWLDSENLNPNAWLGYEILAPVGTEQNTSHQHADVAYANGYLPHKWKIAVATAGHNCVNVRANDLGIILREVTVPPTFVTPESDRVDLSSNKQWLTTRTVIMADCWIGGSLAYRAGKVASVPMLAEPLGSVPLEKVETLVEALLELHLQVAEPSDEPSNVSGGSPGEQGIANETTAAKAATGAKRHFRRLKYTVRRLGIPAIVAWIESRLGEMMKLEPNAVLEAGQWSEHPSLQREPPEQNLAGNLRSKWVANLGVRGGRLRFTDDNLEAWNQLFKAAKRVAIGPRHTILLSGIDEAGLDVLQRNIEGPLANQLVFTGGSKPSPPDRVLTCVGLPTCPLAVEHSEQSEQAWRGEAAKVGDIVVRISNLLADASERSSESEACENQKRRQPSVAVSGCSNGCSAPLTVDLGVIAEKRGSFRLFVGGGGDRLGIPVAVITGPEQLVPTITDLWRAMTHQRKEGHSPRKWLLDRPVSRNFAWPWNENRLS